MIETAPATYHSVYPRSGGRDPASLPDKRSKQSQIPLNCCTRRSEGKLPRARGRGFLAIILLPRRERVHRLDGAHPSPVIHTRFYSCMANFLMLIAALMSRTRTVPQSGHVHSRSEGFRSRLMYPQQLQIFEDGSNCPIFKRAFSIFPALVVKHREESTPRYVTDTSCQSMILLNSSNV